MRGKINVAGGSVGKLNVYTQMTEPSKKDGIWIQCEDKCDSIKAIREANQGYYKLSPFNYLFEYGALTAVGTDFYALGTSISPYNRYNYKFDTLTNIFTRMTDIPYVFYYGKAVSVGANIYLLGGYIYGSENILHYNYKYNTLNDTYTRLEDVPISFTDNPAVAVGTNIYLFTQEGTYRYNTSHNTYTKIRTIPFDATTGDAVVVGTDIYILSGLSNSVYYNYKYDTLTNTYTQMKNIPFKMNYGGIAVIGTDIYVFSNENNYRYNTLNDTYIKLENIPWTFYGEAISVNQEIFLIDMDSKSDTSVNYKYIPSIDNYVNNTIYILFGLTYKTKLSEKFETRFDNVFLYKNNELQEYPTYIGDGIKWKKIREIECPEEPIIPAPGYTIEILSKAYSDDVYGFNKNGDYYESNNQGKDSSYAICQLVINTSKAIKLNIIANSFGEANCDYGIIGDLDEELEQSENIDTYYNQVIDSANENDWTTVTYNIKGDGLHFIQLKYIKDGSGSENNDSLRFKYEVV